MALEILIAFGKGSEGRWKKSCIHLLFPACFDSAHSIQARLAFGERNLFLCRLALFQLDIAIFEPRGDFAIAPHLNPQRGAPHARSDICRRI